MSWMAELGPQIQQPSWITRGQMRRNEGAGGGGGGGGGGGVRKRQTGRRAVRQGGRQEGRQADRDRIVQAQHE